MTKFSKQNQHWSPTALLWTTEWQCFVSFPWWREGPCHVASRHTNSTDCSSLTLSRLFTLRRRLRDKEGLTEGSHNTLPPPPQDTRPLTHTQTHTPSQTHTPPNPPSHTHTHLHTPLDNYSANCWTTICDKEIINICSALWFTFTT